MNRFVRQSDVLQNNPALARATSNLFAQWYDACAIGKRAGYNLSYTDVSVVRRITGADTVCLVALAANYYTTARRTSQVVLGTPSPGGFFGLLASSDREGGGFVFIDARNGEVLWMYGDMPIKGSASPLGVVERILLGFPALH